MKKIIITDSLNGFGLLTVQRLALNGHTVYATMPGVQTKNAKPARDLRQWAIENNADVRIWELDIASDESVDYAVSQIIREAKQIDVLINNAGMLILKAWENLSTKEIEKVFQANVFGAIRMNTAILPHMHLHRSGLIIQMSSHLSRLHLPYLSAYCASQAALDTLAETLSYELIDTGIDSIVIQAGIYPTTELFNEMTPVFDSLEVQDEENGRCRSEQGIYQLFTHILPQNRESVEVAKSILEIVEMPPAKRKLWTTIGIELGQTYVDFINDSTSQYSQRVQKLVGLYSINK